MQCCELWVFYLFSVEIQVHLEVHATVTCLINVTINYPSHLQQDVFPLSDVSHAGWVALGEIHCSCWFFCHLAHCRAWLSLDSSLLPSFCVSSLTDNHFSLPISLQSQLPFKSLLHTTFPITSTTTGFKFYSFLPSNWSLDAKPIFHHHFQTALLLRMHVTESENSWDWKRPLEII